MIEVSQQQQITMNMTDKRREKRKRTIQEWFNLASRKLRRRSLALYLFMTCEVLTTLLVEPYLVSLVSKQHSIRSQFARNLVQSLILSSLYIGQICSMAAIGHASDLYGRKQFLILAVVGNYVGVACMSLIRSWWWAIILRFVTGLCGSAVALSLACITDIGANETPVKTSSMLALSTGCISVARALASIFHTMLPLTGSRILNVYDPYVVSTIAAAAIVAPSAVIVFVMKETNTDTKRSERLLLVDQDLYITRTFGFFQSFATVILNRQLLLVSLLLGLTSFSVSLSSRELLVFASRRVKDYGYSLNSFAIAGYTTGFSLLLVLFQKYLFRGLAERYNLKNLYLIGTVLGIVSLLLSFGGSFPYWITGFAKTRLTNAIAGIFLSVFMITGVCSYMFMIPILNTFLMLVTLKSEGIAFGLAYTVVSLAQVIVPISENILGLIGDSISFPWIPAITSLLALVAAFVAASTGLETCFIERNPHEEEKPVEDTTAIQLRMLMEQERRSSFNGRNDTSLVYSNNYRPLTPSSP